jgi:hypothetical protein
LRIKKELCTNHLVRQPLPDLCGDRRDAAGLRSNPAVLRGSLISRALFILYATMQMNSRWNDTIKND